MKKLITSFIAIVTMMLFGVGSSFQTIAVESNAEDENVQSEIVFVQAGFYPHEEAIYSQTPKLYEGTFIESNGNVRKFSFQNESNNLMFGTLDLSNYPESIILDDTSPQKNLLSKLANVDDFEIIGSVSQQELSYYTSALSGVNTNAEMKLNYSTEDVLHCYTETFGVRNDDEIVFLNGSGAFSFIHTDENALEIDSWLRNLDISETPAESTTATETTTTTTTSAATDTTTITITTETEITTETTAICDTKSDVPQIEFCEVQFILDYEEYYGIFLDSNRNVYSFGIYDVTEDWNLYGDYSEEPIKLTDSMPQEGLLDYLYNHFDEWKLIGKTSEEDYADYKNELNQIDLNTEMVYRVLGEPDVVGLSHMERFAVRYDDNGNRQIVFLCGGLDTEYDLYLENPDEHAMALNQKMIQYEEMTATTTTTVETNQTTTSTDETTTETSSTTATTVATTDETAKAALTNSSTTTALTSDIVKADETTTTTSTETSTNATETTPTTTTTTGDTTLPQTGYSKWYHVVVVLAACMTGTGAVMVIGSGALKRKQK